ncbi:Ig-like domain-containing protein [Paenibacillus sp. IB182496]|uniref:Ig-like domain-containing protein n=1 Tax=Paenibacillus sabuli TaxID=2772509 RepID=A0A927BQP4_9BACL|nr:Ig-like domain-containing protein [Paenibacillus sabuli]MBD2844978.1 Ig-like domain-containing protein [Paenibacillus sabuli]
MHWRKIGLFLMGLLLVTGTFPAYARDHAVTSQGWASSVKGPRLIASYPSPRETSVPRDTDIIITFDSSIKLGNYAPFISLLSQEDLNNQVPVEVTIVKNELILSPTQQLEKGTGYVLFIPVDAVQSLSGSKLRSDYGMEFSTQLNKTLKSDPLWLLPAPPSSGTALETVEAKSTLTSATLSTASMPGQPVMQIFAGASHSGALRNPQQMSLWGKNTSMQLGYASPVESTVPLDKQTGSPYVKVEAGYVNTFALLADGTVQGWGSNFFGILGAGPGGSTTAVQSDPVTIALYDHVQDISISGVHTLALLADGTVWGWGMNMNGELGVGDPGEHVEYYPRPVLEYGYDDLINVESISAGVTHSVAVKTDGSVWSWGSNQYGQLGDGTLTGQWTAVETFANSTTTFSQVQTVSAGYDFTVALKEDGSVWSWGRNDLGQLGDGGTTNRKYPVRVI